MHARATSMDSRTLVTPEACWEVSTCKAWTSCRTATGQKYMSKETQYQKPSEALGQWLREDGVSVWWGHFEETLCVPCGDDETRCLRAAAEEKVEKVALAREACLLRTQLHLVHAQSVGLNGVRERRHIGRLRPTSSCSTTLLRVDHAVEEAVANVTAEFPKHWLDWRKVWWSCSLFTVCGRWRVRGSALTPVACSL